MVAFSPEFTNVYNASRRDDSGIEWNFKCGSFNKSIVNDLCMILYGFLDKVICMPICLVVLLVGVNLDRVCCGSARG